MERIKIKGEGFTVLKDYSDWRIAVITYEYEKNSLEGFQNFGRHNETDEAFILLKGSAKMLLGGNQNKIGELTIEKLKPEEVFVVNKGEWHAILVEKETEVLVVENRNTDRSNTDNKDVTEKQRKIIKKLP